MLLIMTNTFQCLLLLGLPMIGCCLLSKQRRTEPMLKPRRVQLEGCVAETVFEENE